MHPVEVLWREHRQMFPDNAHLPGETVPIGDRRVPDVAGFPLSHGLLAPCGWDHATLPPFPEPGRGVLMLGNHVDALANYEERVANPPVVYGNPCPPRGRKRMMFWSKLYRHLDRASIPHEAVFVTNVHPCFVPGTDARRQIDSSAAGYPTWISRCHRFLLRELDVMRPALVVALGSDPRDFLVDNLGVEDLGSGPPEVGWLGTKWGGVPVAWIRHPSYVQPLHALEDEAAVTGAAWREALS